MKTTTKYLLPTVLGAILISPMFARTADARQLWSAISSGCVLDTASAVKADVNAVFGVNFYDPDRTDTTCGVRAFLLRANLDERERGNTVAGFDSNTDFSVTEPGTGRSRGSVFIPEEIEFHTSYYWVDLELVRSSTTCNPRAVGVHIVPVIL
jgi:hypothetical protein